MVKQSYRIRRWVFIVLSVLWMGVIFSMSAKDADQSTQDSMFFGMKLGAVIHADFAEWPKEEQRAFAERYDYPIRKCAHASEYAVLGIFLTGAIFSTKQKAAEEYKRSLGLAFAFTVLYAISDELHQYFVPGRACMWQDVVIDAVGAAVGTVVCGAILTAIQTNENETGDIRL